MKTEPHPKQLNKIMLDSIVSLSYFFKKASENIILNDVESVTKS